MAHTHGSNTVHQEVSTDTLGGAVLATAGALAGYGESGEESDGIEEEELTLTLTLSLTLSPNLSLAYALALT